MKLTKIVITTAALASVHRRWPLKQRRMLITLRVTLQET